MLATTAFHTSSISNMPLYFFPPLLLFLYLFPGFSLLIPFPYGIPPLNLSPPLIIFLTLASLPSPHLPTQCPTYFSTPPFFFTPFSSTFPSLLLLFLFLHPFSSPCPSSHLFFNHVLQVPPSLIHFLHPISPPTTSYPSSYSSFPFYSFFFLLVLPFFFLSSLLFPLFSPFFSFPLPPLLLFPPPFVVSILVSLFDPSIFETGNDLVIYVRRNRKETWKIITNFEKYMYVLMFTFFTHILDGLQFIKSRITFNLDRCTFELLDATNWWVTLLSLLDQYTFSLVNCLQPVIPFVMSCFISVK